MNRLCAVIVGVLLIVPTYSALCRADADEPGAEAAALQAAKVSELIATGGYAYHQRRYDEALQVADEVLRLDPGNKAGQELRWMARQALSERDKLTWNDLRREQEERLLDNVRRQQIVEADKLDALPEGLRRARKGDEADLLGPARLVREANRETLARLEKTLSVDFKEVPLSQVAEFLSTMGNVNVMVDPKAVLGNRKAADVPVTFTGRDIKLVNVLKWVCRSAGLHYAVRDQVVLITTAEGLEPLKVTGVYNVFDIVAPIPDFNSDAYFNLNLRAVDARKMFDWYRLYPYWYYQDYRPGFGPLPFGGAFAAWADSVDRVRISQPELEEMIDNLIDAEEAR